MALCRFSYYLDHVVVLSWYCQARVAVKGRRVDTVVLLYKAWTISGEA